MPNPSFIRLNSGSPLVNYITQVNLSIDDGGGTASAPVGFLRGIMEFAYLPGQPELQIGDAFIWTGEHLEQHVLIVQGQPTMTFMGADDYTPGGTPASNAVYDRRLELVGLIALLNADYLTEQVFINKNHKHIIQTLVGQRAVAEPLLASVTFDGLDIGPFETFFKIDRDMRFSDALRLLSLSSGFYFTFRGWAATYEARDSDPPQNINADETIPDTDYRYSPQTLQLDDRDTTIYNTVTVRGSVAPIAACTLWVKSPGEESSFVMPGETYGQNQDDFYSYDYHQAAIDTELVSVTGSGEVIATEAGLNLPAGEPVVKLTATREVPFGFPLQLQSGSVFIDEAVGNETIVCALEQAATPGFYVLGFGLLHGTAIVPIVNGVAQTPEVEIIVTVDHAYHFWLVPVPTDSGKFEYAFMVHDETIEEDIGAYFIYQTTALNITGKEFLTPVIIENDGMGVSLQESFRALPKPFVHAEFQHVAGGPGIQLAVSDNQATILKKVLLVSFTNEQYIDAVITLDNDKKTRFNIVNEALDISRPYTLLVNAWLGQEAEATATNADSIADIGSLSGGAGIRRADTISDENIRTRVEATNEAGAILDDLLGDTARGSYSQYADKLSAYPLTEQLVNLNFPTRGFPSQTSRVRMVSTVFKGFIGSTWYTGYEISFGGFDPRENLLPDLIQARRTTPSRFVLPPTGLESGNTVGVINGAKLISYDDAFEKLTLNLNLAAGAATNYELRFADGGWGDGDADYQSSNGQFLIDTDENEFRVYARAIKTGSPMSVSDDSAIISANPVIRPQQVTGVAWTMTVDDEDDLPKFGFIVNFDRPAKTDHVDLWMTFETSGTPTVPINFKETAYVGYREQIVVTGLPKKRCYIKLIPFTRRGISVADADATVLAAVTTYTILLDSTNPASFTPTLPVPSPPTLIEL